LRCLRNVGFSTFGGVRISGCLDLDLRMVSGAENDVMLLWMDNSGAKQEMIVFGVRGEAVAECEVFIDQKTLTLRISSEGVEVS